MSSSNTVDLIGDTAISSDLDDVTEAADLRLTLPPPPPSERDLPPAYLMMDDNGSNSTLTGGGVVFGGRKACDTVSESGIAACAGGRLPGGGFLNLRQCEEEVNKLRKETLSLRLRIYLLEERHGLLPKAGRSAEDGDNVFRINLDLRVEVETMRKELEEKDKLLKDAYNAMEALDTERLRERSELESQLNSLRQTHLDSQMEEFQPTPAKVGERSEALLFEAFGSMNLGKPGEMQGRIEALEMAAGEREELVRSLEERLKQGEMAALEREELVRSLEDRLAERNEGHQSLKARISELHVQVEREAESTTRMKSETVRLQERLEEKQGELAGMAEQMEEAVAKLSGDLGAKSEKVGALEDQLTKTEFCLKGVAEANRVQTAEKEGLEREVRKRDRALEILRAEYESLKGKVRKYRADRTTNSGGGGDNTTASSSSSRAGRSSNASSIDTAVTAVVAGGGGSVEAVRMELEEKAELLKAAYQAMEAQEQERERERAELQAEIEGFRSNGSAEVAILKAQLRSCQMLPGGDQALPGVTRCDQREVEMLKAELRSCRARALREGAGRAMARAGQGFAASVDAHSAGIRAAFEAVRVRLGEMADFLQRLLSDGGDGLLNASALSNCSGVMEMLQRSLEESRRMSQSLLLHEHTGDPNETQGGGSFLGAAHPAALDQWPELQLPSVDDLDLEGDCGDDDAAVEDRIREYESLVLELKDNVRQRIDAQREAERLVVEAGRLRSDGLRERQGREALGRQLAERDQQKSEAESEAARTREAHDALIQELKDNVRARIDAQKETERLRVVLVDVQRETAKLKVLLNGEGEDPKNSSTPEDPEEGDKENAAAGGHRAVFVSRENFEEHEMALGPVATAPPPKHSRQPHKKGVAGEGGECDCGSRIVELERTLASTRSMLDEATGKMEAEEERKRRMERAMKREILKTKKVLKRTTPKSTPATIQE